MEEFDGKEDVNSEDFEEKSLEDGKDVKSELDALDEVKNAQLDIAAAEDEVMNAETDLNLDIGSAEQDSLNEEDNFEPDIKAAESDAKNDHQYDDNGLDIKAAEFKASSDRENEEIGLNIKNAELDAEREENNQNELLNIRKKPKRREKGQDRFDVSVSDNHLKIPGFNDLQALLKGLGDKPYLRSPDLSKIDEKTREGFSAYMNIIKMIETNPVLSNIIRNFRDEKRGRAMVQNFKFVGSVIKHLESLAELKNMSLDKWLGSDTKSVAGKSVGKFESQGYNSITGIKAEKLNEIRDDIGWTARLMKVSNDEDQMKKCFEAVIREHKGEYSLTDLEEFFPMKSNGLRKNLKEMFGDEHLDYFADGRGIGTIRHDAGANLLAEYCERKPEIATFYYEPYMPFKTKDETGAKTRLDHFIAVNDKMREILENKFPNLAGSDFLLSDMTHSSEFNSIVAKLVKYPPGPKSTLIITVTDPKFTIRMRDRMVKQLNGFNEKMAENPDYKGNFIPKKTLERTAILTHKEFPLLFGIDPKSAEGRLWTGICKGNSEEVKNIFMNTQFPGKKGNPEFLEMLKNNGRKGIFGRKTPQLEEKLALLRNLELFYPTIAKFMKLESMSGKNEFTYWEIAQFLKMGELGTGYKLHEASLVINGMISKGMIEEIKIKKGKMGKGGSYSQKFKLDEQHAKKLDLSDKNSLTDPISNIITDLLGEPMEFNRIHNALLNSAKFGTGLPVTESWKPFDTYRIIKSMVSSQKLAVTQSFDENGRKIDLFHMNGVKVPPSIFEQKAINLVRNNGGYIKRREFMEKLMPHIEFGTSNCQNKIADIIGTIDTLEEMMVTDTNSIAIIHLSSLQMRENTNDGCIYLDDNPDPVIYTERIIHPNGRISLGGQSYYVGRKYGGKTVNIRETEDGLIWRVFLDKNLEKDPLLIPKKRQKKDPDVRKVQQRGQIDYEGNLYNIGVKNGNKEVFIQKTADESHIEIFLDKNLENKPIIRPTTHQEIRRITKKGSLSYRKKNYYVGTEYGDQEVSIVEKPKKNQLWAYPNGDLSENPIVINTLGEQSDDFERTVSHGSFNYNGNRIYIGREHSGKKVKIVEYDEGKKIKIYPDKNLEKILIIRELEHIREQIPTRKIRSNGRVSYKGESYNLGVKNKGIKVFIKDLGNNTGIQFFSDEKMTKIIPQIVREGLLKRKITRFGNLSFDNRKYYMGKENMGKKCLVDDSGYPNLLIIHIGDETKIIPVKKKERSKNIRKINSGGSCGYDGYNYYVGKKYTGKEVLIKESDDGIYLQFYPDKDEDIDPVIIEKIN